jgi:hypothetical protein
MWNGIGLVEKDDGGGGYGPRRRRWVLRYLWVLLWVIVAFK